MIVPIRANARDNARSKGDGNGDQEIPYVQDQVPH